MMTQRHEPSPFPLRAENHLWVWITAVWGVVYLYPFLSAWWTNTWVFHDPDTTMRLYRVEAWIQGEAWWNPLITRIGPETQNGGGLALHWTRPLDVLIALGALVFKLGMPLKQALTYSAAFLNILGPWVGAVVLCQSARSVFSPLGCLLAGLLVLTEGWMLGYASAFHPDHHSLLACGAVIALGLVLKMAPRPSLFYAHLLGAVCALGIWISFEWIFILGVIWAGLIVISMETPLWREPVRSMLRSALLFLVAFLLMERGPEWHAWEHDRLSLVHVFSVGLLGGLTACTHALWDSPMSYLKRWAIVLIVGTTCVGLLWLFIPSFITGFIRVVDPRIEDIWHDHVSEILPLLKGEERWAVLVYALGHPGAALALGLWGFKNARKGSSSHSFLSVPVLGLLLYIPLALYQVRHALFAQMLSIIPLIYGLERWVLQPSRRPLFRVSVTALVLLFPTVGGFLLSPPNPKVFVDSLPEDCRTWNRMMAELPHLSTQGAPSIGQPSTLFLTTLGVESTRILFETPWRILGVPYHRNVQGITGSFAIYSAPNPVEGLKQLHHYEVNYILFARDHLQNWMDSAQVPSSAFYHDLIQRAPLPQLYYVALPPPLDQRFTLIQVVSPLL